MKIYRYFIGLISLFALTACNDWLDIQPQDTTTEEQIFETGDGFRNALNGIYRQMADFNMYGKVLTWGGLDAMAQYYSPSTGTDELYFSRYEYTGTQIYPIVQSIWSEAFNNIANCNNLIQRIEKEPATTFAKGDVERELILGEALALRALLHFDMYRLFAPTKDDGKSYIPYVDVYPCTFKEYITNTKLLERVVEDLKKAKELVGKFDIPRISWMRVHVRYENDHQNITTEDQPDDLFLAFRGYRLNYYAICGMLARVYMYQDKYKEAFDEANFVIEIQEETSMENLFKFSNANDLKNGNTKFYDELLFCLSNQKLSEKFKNSRSTEKYHVSASDPKLEWYEDDDGDIRYQLLTDDEVWYKYNRRYLVEDGSKGNFAKDMIPMLRIGEMYYIRAEYYYSLGKNTEAAEEFAKVRRGHSCNIEKVNSSNNNWFKTELIKEARREFMGEGQLFYYYKRLGIRPSRKMTSDEQFVLPYPQNEEL